VPVPQRAGKAGAGMHSAGAKPARQTCKKVMTGNRYVVFASGLTPAVPGSVVPQRAMT